MVAQKNSAMSKGSPPQSPLCQVGETYFLDITASATGFTKLVNENVAYTIGKSQIGNMQSSQLNKVLQQMTVGDKMKFNVTAMLDNT